MPGLGAFLLLEIQDVSSADSPTKHAILAYQQNLVDCQNLAKYIYNLNRTTKETNTNILPPLQPLVLPLQLRPSSRIVYKLYTIEGDLEVASTDGGVSIYIYLELPKNIIFIEIQAACLERFGNNKGSIKQLEKKVDIYTHDIVEWYNEL